MRPARGLYQLADGAVDARRTLAEAAALVPKGIICLVSALQFHGLTLQMPSSVWMAIERTAWRPRIEYPPIRFVRFTGSALSDGIKRHRIEGVEVTITDPARTIVDCFRYRAKVGIDVAMEGLRQRKATSDQLWRYAGMGQPPACGRELSPSRGLERNFPAGSAPFSVRFGQLTWLIPIKSVRQAPAHDPSCAFWRIVMRFSRARPAVRALVGTVSPV